MGLASEVIVPGRIVAFIAGGSQQANQSTTKHLADVGIDVVGQALTEHEVGTSLPASTQVVLMMKDMISHNMSNKVYLLARKNGIRSIDCAALSWTRTKLRLEKAGLVDLARPIQKGPDVAPNDKTKTHDPAHDPSNNSHVARSQAIKALVKQFCDKNKERLATYTNVELANDVSVALGDEVGPGTVGNHRVDMGYKVPPKGYKRPRQQRLATKAASVLAKPAQPGAHVTAVPGQTITFGANSDPEPDIDVIQGLLAEVVKKHKLSKIYITFDNNRWDANWEFVAVQTRSKTY